MSQTTGRASDSERLDVLERLNRECRLLTHISGSERRTVTVVNEGNPRGEIFPSLRAAADAELEILASHNPSGSPVSVSPKQNGGEQ